MSKSMENPTTRTQDSSEEVAGSEVQRDRPPKVVFFSNRTALWTTFVFIYISMLSSSLINNVVLSLTPYVLSRFSGHGLLSIVFMTNRIASGLLRLPLAKFTDTFGRLAGFLLCAGVTILGLVLQAVAQNLTTTAVAQVFHGIGWSCIDYVLSVLVADMTSLENRSLAYGILATPIIATSFASPKLAELLYTRFNLGWVFGASAVIMAASCVPLVIALINVGRKSLITNQADSVESGKCYSPLLHVFRYLLIELDLPGIILAMTGLCCVLLPLNLSSTVQNGWRSTTVIALIVVGSFSLVGFIAWEKWLAPVTCVKMGLMRNKDVLGGCLVVLFSSGSVGFWQAYYSSYLQVVHNQSIATAGYVTNALTLAFAVSAPAFGGLIRITGNYKYPALCAAPLLGIFTGLLLVLHQPDSALGLLVMCQVLIGISDRALTATSLMSVSSTVGHRDIAATIGIWGTFSSVGMAVTLGLSGAIWTNVLPRALEAALPPESKDLTAKIYGSLETQKKYALHSPIRDAIVAAYWSAQQKMVLAGVCMTPLALGCVLMWRSLNVKNQQEPEAGTVRGVIW